MTVQGGKEKKILKNKKKNKTAMHIKQA